MDNVDMFVIEVIDNKGNAKDLWSTGDVLPTTDTS